MFKEKVGDIFVDMKMNMDKKSLSTVQNGTNQAMGVAQRGISAGFSKLKAGLVTLLGAVTIGALNKGLDAMSDKFKTSVDYLDQMKTYADSMGTTVLQQFKLEGVAKLGDIDQQQLNKSIIKFKKSFLELQLGKNTDNAGLLAQAGVTKEQDLVSAYMKFLSSVKKTVKKGGENKAYAESALFDIFGKIDGNTMQFFTGGGVDAFLKVNKEYGKKKPLWNQTAKVADKAGSYDDTVKLQEMTNKFGLALGFVNDNSLKIYMDNMNREAQRNIALSESTVAMKLYNASLNLATEVLVESAKAIKYTWYGKGVDYLDKKFNKNGR